tara:strand:+ start:76 stop:237 length:162 start_codon:yes stop_codon:yes gene_type:complete
MRVLKARILPYSAPALAIVRVKAGYEIVKPRNALTCCLQYFAIVTECDMSGTG